MTDVNDKYILIAALLISFAILKFMFMFMLVFIVTLLLLFFD